MRQVYGFSVTGHHLHQTVEGVGDDLEIKQYGVGEQDGKRGVYGVVLYPYGRDAKPQTLLVINLDGKWIPTSQEERCHGCQEWYPSTELTRSGAFNTFRLLCVNCKSKEK